MNIFDLCQAPLKGINLIEAGAGTGKTFTIAGLYLRLVAESGLGVDEILVVTFTTAATEELKSRIRRRLLDARSALDRADSMDDILNAIGVKGISTALIRQRVNDALVNFDRAAVSTIHGFCRRVLENHAFETGHLFDAELIQDPQPLIQETADDFWRRRISPAPFELGACAAEKLKGPEALVRLARLQPNAMIHLKPLPKPALGAVKSWRLLAHELVAQWPGFRQDVITILQSPALNATSYGKCGPGDESPRSRKVADLAGAMDGWNGQYPLFDGFDRFTTTALAKATKKGYQPAAHPFLDLCQAAWDQYQEMAAELTAYLSYLKMRFLGEAAQRVQEKKDRLNVMSFDDLLLGVNQALSSSARTGLIQSMRQRYRAALVDEFQDTDALQYGIFSQLFGYAEQALFFIGDPKQAIYSFRGADLFSYIGARSKADTIYTLSRNWRSDPGLIDAVNAIFNGHRHPFGFETIGYTDALPARTIPRQTEPPMVLWYLTPSESDLVSKPISVETATAQIVAAVAGEIVRLIHPQNGRWAPEQIAVLTRSHHQAMLVKAALAQNRVPAVLHSAGSVFDTREAEELALVLRAMATPGDQRLVRSAFATELLGVAAGELCQWLEDDSLPWQQRWAGFDAYHQIWVQFGFFRMFNLFLHEEGIKPRLLAQRDGERRITNLLHLGELLHQASIEQKLNPDGLVKWLETRRADPNGGEEVQTLRLESDAHAVRIVTIHKSKGLEFDVVFCPFTWAGVRPDADAVVFHDPTHGDRLTLAMGPDIEEGARVQSEKEALAENIRLLYVALTRARQKCYLVWGRINQTQVSAPAFVFHARSLSLVSPHSLRSLIGIMGSLSDAQMIADLKNLSGVDSGTIAVSPLPSGQSMAHHATSRDILDTGPRQRYLRFGIPWRIASYSAITAHASHAPSMADQQAFEPGLDRDAGHDFDRQHEGIDYSTLFDFPRGARTGLFFHELLEQWPLNHGNSQHGEAWVRKLITAYGFDEQWIPAVMGMLGRLSQTPLPAKPSPFAFGQVAPENRLTEMVFHFPLKPVDGAGITQIFEAHGDPDDNYLILPFLRRLSFSTMTGFMKGFVDLVFWHDGRYYLADWKSNFLGDSPSDYAIGALERVMAADYYFLQYHLYAVALDAYLQRRVKSYRYEDHFGGVFYIFLRGLQNHGADTGIYWARPRAGMIAALRDLLLDSKTDGVP